MCWKKKLKYEVAHLLISHCNVAPLKSTSENHSPVNFSDWDMTVFGGFLFCFMYIAIFLRMYWLQLENILQNSGVSVQFKRYITHKKHFRLKGFILAN